MLKKYIIKDDNNDFTFDTLSDGVNFEDIIIGRKGANIGDITEDKIPIVRTTSTYRNPNQKFSDKHYKLIEEIQKQSDIPDIILNNALIEIYDNKYCRMGFHTDQELDLKEDSYICIFSCYKNPDTKNFRSLIFKNKVTNKEDNRIILDNNSVVIFSTQFNEQHLHKIMLEKRNNSDINDDSEWLGITFRLSKTFIHFIDKYPYFCNSIQQLKLATYTERNLFINYKSQENKLCSFKYPTINYTINPGDLIRPKL